MVWNTRSTWQVNFSTEDLSIHWHLFIPLSITIDTMTLTTFRNWHWTTYLIELQEVNGFKRTITHFASISVSGNYNPNHQQIIASGRRRSSKSQREGSRLRVSTALSLLLSWRAGYSTTTCTIISHASQEGDEAEGITVNTDCDLALCDERYFHSDPRPGKHWG